MKPMSGQTRTLLTLRWTMLREPRSRFGLCAACGMRRRTSRRGCSGGRTPVRCGRSILRHRPRHAVPLAGIRALSTCLATGCGRRQSAVSSRATFGLSHPTVDTLPQLIAPDADQPGLAPPGRGAGRCHCVRYRAGSAARACTGGDRGRMSSSQPWRDRPWRGGSWAFVSCEPAERFC